MTPRSVCLDILCQVLDAGQNLDIVFDKKTDSLDGQDRNFVRMLVTTTLRRLGQIDAVISKHLKKPIPRKALKIQRILELGVCQILFMHTAAYASVNESVELTRLTMKNDIYTGLVNALLRQTDRQRDEFDPEQGLEKNIPTWLFDSWQKDHGAQKAKRFLSAFVKEPTLSLTVKENPQLWAEKLGGFVGPNQTVRLTGNPFIPSLAGYSDGEWWIQDTAATFPVALFGNIKGLKVADLCAAPGGKTAQLIAAGANVDAFDISEKRMKRVTENLSRLKMTANIYVANANDIKGEKIYDRILLDAPCSATGTFRRHPDMLYHRRPEDIDSLAKAQENLLRTAHRLLKDNGQVVYCTCSLQKKEGEDIIRRVRDIFAPLPITAPFLEPFLTKDGFVRTFPDEDMDGFFMALLKKS